MAVSTPSLPHGLAELVRSLAKRAQIVRAVRGGCFVIAALGLGFGFVYLADAWLGLCSLGLRLASLVWALMGLLVFAWKVAWPLLRRPDPYSLAVLVEQKNPGLEERLSATVALTRHRDAAHGAETLIDQLGEEANECCKAIRPGNVIPFHPLRKWLVGAGFVIAMTMISAVVVDEYRFFARRFVSAWIDPVLGYRLEVTPGDSAVAVGDPLTIHARLIAEDVGAALPSACHVVYQVGDQPTHMRQLTSIAEHAFQLSLEHVNGDVLYHVEAGEYRSPTYRVAAVVPVEIEDETLHVTPPAYVNPKVVPPLSQTIRPPVSRIDQEKQPPFEVPQSVVQFSKLRYVWRFNRPVPHAEGWRTISTKKTVPFQWSPDRRQAEVEILAADDDILSLTLSLDAEHGIRTQRQTIELKILVDAPPVFTERISGLPLALSAKDVLPRAAPDDIIRLRTRVEDNVGLDRLELEYRVNDGGMQIHTLAKADGQQVIAGEFPFSLKGKVKEGDVIQLRLKATDNRLVKDLKPQSTYEPQGQDAWRAIRIDRRAKPLHEQEIAGQREEFNRRLAEIKKKLEREQALVKQVKQAGHAQAFLPAQALENLDRARQLNRDIAKDLLQYAAEAMSFSGLLAELALDIAQGELSEASHALTAAEQKHRDPAMRDPLLDQAERNLAQALKKLTGLGDANDRFAQDRLDQKEMQRLADLQDELARRAAELAKDPLGKEELELLRAMQELIAQQLQALAGKSQLFQEAMQQHQQALAQRLAQQARDLGKQQANMKPSDPKQKELAEETGKLAEELMRLGQKGDPKGMAGAKEAAHAAQEAKAAMDKAGKETDHAKAMDAAIEAALKLEMAAKKADELAQAMPKLMGKDGDETGKALVKALDEVNKARDKLRKNGPAKAQPAMKQAAQAMQQAAQEAGRQLTKSQRQVGPPGNITSPRPSFGATGPASTVPLQEVLGKFNGQSWGELPGEVKNRIMQDWQSRYGSDFAQVVRRYFEQLAVDSRK